MRKNTLRFKGSCVSRNLPYSCDSFKILFFNPGKESWDKNIKNFIYLQNEFISIKDLQKITNSREDDTEKSDFYTSLCELKKLIQNEIRLERTYHRNISKRPAISGQNKYFELRILTRSQHNLVLIYLFVNKYIALEDSLK